MRIRHDRRLVFMLRMERIITIINNIITNNIITIRKILLQPLIILLLEALATRAWIAFVSILRCVLPWFCTTSERTVIKVE